MQLKKKPTTIGEKIKKFDSLLIPTLESFNLLFKTDVKGDKDDYVRILYPITNNGRIIEVNGRLERVFFDKYLTDIQLTVRKWKSDREARGGGHYDAAFRQMNKGEGFGIKTVVTSKYNNSI